MKTTRIVTLSTSLGAALLLLEPCAAASAQERLDTRYTIQSFQVGTGPLNFAFDGANIWVANTSDSTVTKLRASDGERLGNFPVGANPWYLTFDGENIWVANDNGSSVTKLRASDGALLGTFPTGSNPHGIAFDGDSIWVALVFDNAVIKL